MKLNNLFYLFLNIILDVLSNRKLLAMLLSKRGLECDVAIDGVNALKVVEENPNKYDIIFMDNIMPNMVRLSNRLTARKLIIISYGVVWCGVVCLLDELNIAKLYKCLICKCCF